MPRNCCIDLGLNQLQKLRKGGSKESTGSLHRFPVQVQSQAKFCLIREFKQEHGMASQASAIFNFLTPPIPHTLKVLPQGIEKAEIWQIWMKELNGRRSERERERERERESKTNKLLFKVGFAFFNTISFPHFGGGGTFLHKVWIYLSLYLTEKYLKFKFTA